MRQAAFGLPALAILGSLLAAEDLHRTAPAYSAAGFVNAASFQTGSFAANTIVSLFGTGLARNTRGLTGGDIANGLLPTILDGTDMTVRVNNIAATVYYASPTQVNFLIPSNLIPGPAEIVLSVGAQQGTTLRATLDPAAPALFQADAEFAIVTRPDGSVATPENPPQAGDIVILWATGLGETRPAQVYRRIANAPAPLVRIADFRVALNGQVLSPASVLYAGIAPGFAGLYQVNLRLPAEVTANPEVQIGFEGRMSPSRIRLPAVGLPAPETFVHRLD